MKQSEISKLNRKEYKAIKTLIKKNSLAKITKALKNLKLRKQGKEPIYEYINEEDAQKKYIAELEEIYY